MCSVVKVASSASPDQISRSDHSCHSRRLDLQALITFQLAFACPILVNPATETMSGFEIVPLLFGGVAAASQAAVAANEIRNRNKKAPVRLNQSSQAYMLMQLTARLGNRTTSDRKQRNADDLEGRLHACMLRKWRHCDRVRAIYEQLKTMSPAHSLMCGRRQMEVARGRIVQRLS